MINVELMFNNAIPTIFACAVSGALLLLIVTQFFCMSVGGGFILAWIGFYFRAIQ
jgi:hypothetical protein